MLACEQNQRYHMEEIQKYSSTSYTGIPETLSTHFNSGFNGRFEDSTFFRDVFGGESFADGFGTVRDYNGINGIDYFRLRRMSRQLFTENMYAAAVEGRLNTNIINEGLKLQSNPSKIVTNFDDAAHVAWTEKTEELWKLWSSDKSVDVEEKHTLAGLQKVLFQECFVEGDVLVVIKMDEKTFTPKIKLIPGRNVQSGANSNDIAANGNRVIHGVEIDKSGRHVAYHVIEDNELGINFKAKRIMAKGRTSSRTSAYLHYYTPPPVGKTRGFPVLMRILQALAQIGRYSAFELKAAEVNAHLAMYIEKTKNVPGTNPVGGATLKTAGEGPIQEVKDDIGRQRLHAGTIINQLAFGEVPHSFDTKRPNINFAGFKKSILQDIALSLGIPPEVFLLMFENSFSASRQATIEFKALVMKDRAYFYEQFNQNVYSQFLLGMVMNNKIEASGYVEAFKAGDVIGKRGWIQSRFTGFVKQNVDILKEAKAYKEYIDEGLMDREMASLELTDTDFDTNVKRLLVQNEKLAKARDPLLGEINTSISRVEKDKELDPDKSVDGPKKRSQRNQTTQLLGQRVLNVVIEMVAKQVADNYESADYDIDSMDIEKELQEV